MTSQENELERAQHRLEESQKELRELSFKFLLEGLNQLATIAASALALLVTFRSTLIGTEPQYVWLVTLSWASLGGAVIGAIWSKLDMSETLTMAGADRVELERLVPRLRANIRWRRFSAGSFVVGVASLIAFGIANL